MSRRLVTLALAGAALAAGLAPGVASAGGPPPSTFCQVRWRWVYVADDVAYPSPYMVC
jgi:hypothetical protein